MKTLIKIDLDSALRENSHVILEIGCGDKKKYADSIGVDRIDLPQVDIVADIEQGLSFLPDNSIDEIHCRSVLEHVDNFEYLIREIVRVLKAKGKANIFVPHFSNPYYYSDFTHKRFFGLYTFYYFVDPQQQLKRKVPAYYTDIRINIISQKLIFRSSFWFRRGIKKLASRLFNSTRFMQEFYEEHLCYIFPCDGIEIVFTAKLII